MARVDKTALDQALSELEAVGLIRGWQSRPLNMYLINVFGDEVMRPDAREAAMWVQGVRYAVNAERLRAALEDEEALDREKLEQALNVMIDWGVLQSWECDEDGDYRLVSYGEEPAHIPARGMASWMAGAYAAHQAARNGPPRDNNSTEEARVRRLLDALQSRDVIEAWSMDQEGDYLVKAIDQEARWVLRRDIDSWLAGALVVQRAGARLSEEERVGLRSRLRSLRERGLIDSWEAEDRGYRIWRRGHAEALEVSERDALVWLMGLEDSRAPAK